MKQFPNVASGLPMQREKPSLQRVLDERLMLSESIHLVNRIIGSYPRAMLKDIGDGYIGALAATLCSYPKSIALRCAKIPDGIVSEECYPPSIARVIAWCEKATEPIRMHAQRESRIEKQLADREVFIREQTFDRQQKLSYDELKEKFGDWKDGWRLPGTKAMEERAKARDVLISEIGQDAFHALPDAPARNV